MEWKRLPVLNDNYVWLLHEPVQQKTAVVDPALAEPVLDALEENGWTLDYIFNTHHHFDHVGGNDALKAATGCQIIGPLADKDRIPGIDIALGDGDIFDFGAERAMIFDVPGHTKGHIAWWFEGPARLFCGDTLFAMGCGRLFEGTPDQMTTSLAKFDALPDHAQIHCAHEYTESNAAFAISVDPDNADLKARIATIKEQRSRGEATVPFDLGTDRRTNPFLRADDPAIAAHLGLAGQDKVRVFAEIRQRKDNF